MTRFNKKSKTELQEYASTIVVFFGSFDLVRAQSNLYLKHRF